MAEDLDPKVKRRYRELGEEQPPRELDQAILAAAHRATDRPHAPLVAPAGRHRWYFSLAAAAVPPPAGGPPPLVLLASGGCSPHAGSRHRAAHRPSAAGSRGHSAGARRRALGEARS